MNKMKRGLLFQGWGEIDAGARLFLNEFGSYTHRLKY